MAKIAKNNIFIWAYYALLLFVLLSWSDPLQPPPMLYRLAFLFAVILPTYWKQDWTASVLLLFIISGTQGYSFSYMPYETYVYVMILAGLAFLYGRFQRRTIKIPLVLILLFLYVSIINFVTNAEWNGMSNGLLLSLLLCLFVDDGDYKQIERVSTVFAITSIVLSYQFYKNFSLTSVLTDSGFEQAGWQDRNYFGVIVGMGALISIIQLLSNPRNNIFNKCLYVVSLVMAIVTLGMNASRGAVLSLGGAVMILLMLSKLKPGKKAFIIIGVLAMVFIMYNYNVFDYLIYRLENDDGTGSGRVIILEKKWAAYTGLDFLTRFWGMGSYNGLKLGYGATTGFHNEFFAMLVEYGFVGLIMLLVMLFEPCWKYWNRYSTTQAPVIVSLCFYLIITGFTLEPLTTGFCSFFLFYFYIVMWCNIRDKQLR